MLSDNYPHPQLRITNNSLLKALLEYYRRGNEPPPHLLDSLLILEKRLHSHFLHTQEGSISIENAIENALEEFLKSNKRMTKSPEQAAKKTKESPAAYVPEEGEVPVLKINLADYADTWTPEQTQQLSEFIALVYEKNPEIKRILLEIKFEHLDHLGISIPELMRLYGNQTLTGAPFIPGGVVHTSHVQIGNYLAVPKYVVISGERDTNGNLLLVLEEQGQDTLEQEYRVEEELKEERDKEEQQHEYTLQHSKNHPHPIPS